MMESDSKLKQVITFIGTPFVGTYNYVKSLFYSNGKPQPTYFWISILMGFIVWMLWKYMKNTPIPDKSVILGMCGFVATWIIIYNKTGKKQG